MSELHISDIREYITQINLTNREIVIGGFYINTESITLTRGDYSIGLIDIDLIVQPIYYDYMYHLYKEVDGAIIEIIHRNMKLRFKVLQVREISPVNPDTHSTLIKVLFRCEEDPSTRFHLDYNI